MTDTIGINRQATLMADWSCFVDDVLHQDPEVAEQQGYGGSIMPEGALSIAAVEPELIDLDLLREGRLRRLWTGYAPAAGGDQLGVSVEKEANAVTATFTSSDGRLIALERLERADPIRGKAAGEPSFRTGPIDLSRVRALLWSVGCVRGEPAWNWGQEPPLVVERALRMLLPSIIAGRAATGPARWVHRVVELSCQPTGAGFYIGDSIDAVVHGPAPLKNICLAVENRPIAYASVTLKKVTRATMS
jgi:hypothetical protein